MRQIEYFMAAVEHRGALAAAKAMNVSQPSISHAIGELEALWCERLFTRVPSRGLELTAAGKRRYKEARELMQRAAQLGARDTASVVGDLSVGCFATLGARHLPPIIRHFQNHYPDVRLTIQEGDTEELVEEVERGTLDLALIYDMELARQVTLHAVGEQSPYALLPEGHRLAKQTAVSIRELSEEPFFLLDMPHSRDYFLSLFRLAGVSPSVALELRSVEMIRSLVANGHGISILVTRPVGDMSYDGRPIVCRPLDSTIPAQRVVVVAPQTTELPRPAAAFLEVMRDRFMKS
ncbi:DNA-binding transcriptional LysR family regulator [Paraburkholderia fungorum]|uniref:LysR family transcriptional regulator n=1 Tax=Paraburkholderia fungorum TaxID=134537 RepID=UPI00184981B8|nr:LysR family transcriptional regulator [Paraburkholderia fungorum]MBB4518352.1 DNA-binding transcriptional LysR family regulator [Paraburkholderia fungorum]